MSGPRIGVVGLGDILRAHVDAIEATGLFRVAVVHDQDPNKTRAVARTLDCAAADSFEALLEARPDVVVLLLPHDLHTDTAVAALEAGANVLVEKPMANSVAECRAMLAASERAGRVLRVADSASFHPGALETGRRFEAGALGRFLTGGIVNLRYYFRDDRKDWFLDPERGGGGMFANVGLHRLALARTALPGLRPATVDAAVSFLPQWRVEACTSALVRYADHGAMHYEEVGYVERPEWFAARTHFHFERGLVGVNDTEWRFAGRDGETVTVPLTPSNGYEGVYRALFDALEGNAARPDARDSAEDVAIVRAMYASGRENRRVSLDEDAFAV